MRSLYLFLFLAGLAITISLEAWIDCPSPCQPIQVPRIHDRFALPNSRSIPKFKALDLSYNISSHDYLGKTAYSYTKANTKTSDQIEDASWARPLLSRCPQWGAHYFQTTAEQRIFLEYQGQHRQFEQLLERRRNLHRKLQSFTSKLLPTLPVFLQEYLKNDPYITTNYRKLVQSNLSAHKRYLVKKAKKWKAQLVHNHHKLYDRRVKALDDLEKNNGSVWQSRVYNVSPKACHILEHYGIDEQLHTQCVGNVLQQVLHSEILEALENFPKLGPRHYTNPFLYCLSDAAADSTQLARFCNSLGCMRHGFDMSDFAWRIIDFLRAYNATALGGAWDAFTNFLTSWAHPIDKNHDLVSSGYEVSRALAKLIYKSIYWGYVHYGDKDHVMREYIGLMEDMLPILEALEKQLEDTPPPELVKDGRSLLTHWLIPGSYAKILKAFYGVSTTVEYTALLKHAAHVTKDEKLKQLIQNPGTVLMAQAVKIAKQLLLKRKFHRKLTK